MSTDTHTDHELIPMMDEAATWLVRGGLSAPVLEIVYSLRAALTRAHEEEAMVPRSVLAIVKAPVDEVTIHPGQIRLWQKIGLVETVA